MEAVRTSREEYFQRRVDCSGAWGRNDLLESVTANEMPPEGSQENRALRTAWREESVFVRGLRDHEGRDEEPEQRPYNGEGLVRSWSQGERAMGWEEIASKITSDWRRRESLRM